MTREMTAIYRVVLTPTIALAILFSISGCKPNDSAYVPPNRIDRKAWPIVDFTDGYYINPGFNIEITGATTFTINGVKCRLLGVKEPTDDARKQQAMKFFKEWLDHCHGHINFANREEPLLIDEICVVWIFRMCDPSTDINGELLINNLADLDIDTFNDYKFTELTKEGDRPEVDWKGYLKAALEKKSK